MGIRTRASVIALTVAEVVVGLAILLLACGSATAGTSTETPDGRATPVVPNAVIQYRVEDLYGRPWAAYWEEYFEKGMQRPEREDFLDFSRK